MYASIIPEKPAQGRKAPLCGRDPKCRRPKFKWLPPSSSAAASFSSASASASPGILSSGNFREVSSSREKPLRRRFSASCVEELAIHAVIGEELDSYHVQYPGGTLTRLFFFHVTKFSGEPRNLDFEQIVWARRGLLSTYDFLEGDVAFLRKLGL